MRNTKVVLGALLAALVMTNAGLGQELDGTLKKIKSSNTLTLGYLESAPPFSFPGPDRRPVGYSIDLCTHVASAIQKQLGINLKLNWVPVTTENRLDMVALADKRIAVIPGTTTETALAKFLKEEFVTVQYVRIKNHLEGLAAVEKGLAEAFASDRGILVGLAVTSKDPSRFALPGILFSYEPYGFMVRRNDAAFRLAVNRALAELYRSGGIVPIYERWFGGFGNPSEAIQAMYMLNGLPE